MPSVANRPEIRSAQDPGTTEFLAATPEVAMPEVVSEAPTTTLLVLDEVSGELVEIEAVAAPAEGASTADAAGDDWVVVTDPDPVPAGSGATPATESLIDWESTTTSIDELLPPVAPGTSGVDEGFDSVAPPP